MRTKGFRNTLTALPSWKFIKWTIVAGFAVLIILSEFRSTNWRTIYEGMSALDESAIEKGLGISYSDGLGYYFTLSDGQFPHSQHVCPMNQNHRFCDSRPPFAQLDPRPILKKLKAGGLHWDGYIFKDAFGKPYSRAEVFERLFSEQLRVR